MSSSDYIEINEGEDGRFSLYHLDENQVDLGRPLASGLSLREAILQAQGRDTEYGIHVTFRGRPLEGARPHWSIRVDVGGMSWKVEA